MLQNQENITARTIWLKTRRRLNGNYEINDDWRTAVKLFERRIENRYFAPIDRLVKLKYFEGEGFPIVTLQCAMIETFAAFKKGVIHNPNYQEGTDPSFQYKRSDDLFIEFLLSEEIFKDNFFVEVNGNKRSNQPFNAKNFYSNVRCGLMHETRIKKNWKIKVKKKYDRGIFLEKIGNDKIIYRTELQRQLKKYFQDYLRDLLNPDNNELRKLFARKLDHLLELTGRSKRGCDWWQE